MKYSLLFIFFLVLYSNVLKAIAPESTSVTGIRFSYFGTVLYPGFKLGLERPYKVIQVSRSSNKDTTIIHKQRYLSYTLGLYRHKSFHTNCFFLVELVRRKVTRKRLFFEASFGLGISRTFFDKATYQVSEKGEVKKVPLAGNFYGILSAGGSFGYDFSIKTHKPVCVFIKPAILIMLPYNRFIYPRPTVEVGIIWKVNNFSKSNPKIVHKLKNCK